MVEGKILHLQLQSSVSRSLLTAREQFSSTLHHSNLKFSFQVPCPILFSLLMLLSLAFCSPPLGSCFFFFLLEVMKLLFQSIDLCRQCFSPSLLERVKKAEQLLFCSSDTGKIQWKPDRVFTTRMFHAS